MKNKYILYARKSSESEDRQVLSIDSQIKELKDIASKQNLDIKRILQESHSAKAPGRPIFDSMIEKIQSGEVNGILAWSADRLSRNPVDSGMLIHLFDTEKLHTIITPRQSFCNNPNDKFMLQVFCGQAKLENDNKGLAAKRGMKSKAELGWYPTRPPLGYINASGKSEGYRFSIIKKDPKRFSLIKNMWDLMLTGNYNPPEIAKIANKEWGLRTRKTKHSGGNPISRSTIYSILKHPFYYGEFEWPKESGNWYKGEHKAMITKDEYNQVQKLLGTTNDKRPEKHEFAFTGMIKCGECHSSITAEKHTKHYPNTNNTATYIYYRCTKKNNNTNCSQKYLRKEDLEKQILNILSQITIPESFKEWSIKHLRKLNKEEAKTRKKIHLNLQSALEDAESKLDNLLDMKLAEQISKEKYEEKKRELTTEKEGLEEKLADGSRYAQKRREKAEEAFDFACHAKQKFETGDLKEKKIILSKLGSNFILKNKKIRIKLKKPLLKIKKANNKMLEKYTSLEPDKVMDKSEYLGDVDPNNPVWLPGLDLNQ